MKEVKFMKKIISLLITAVMLFSLAACGSDEKYEVGGDEKILGRFSETMSVEEIFKDIKNVDLTMKMDTNGLTKETTENEEDSTTDIIYKDADGNIVYESGEGYGEKFFKYHTKSASGNDIVCNYYNEGYDSVTVDSDYYHISFSNLNKDKPFGAESVYVCAKSQDIPVLDSQICYEYFDKWIPTYALYCDDEGYHIFSSWEEEKGKFETDSYVKYLRHSEEPEVNTEILKDSALTIKPEFVFGNHKFSYLDTPANKWYLTADFVLSFETEKQREKFMKKYNIEKTEEQGNENEGVTLRTGEMTVPIAKDCGNFTEIVKILEIDDNSYYTVSVNDNGEISEITRGGMYSFY